MRAVYRYEDLKSIGIDWSRKTIYQKIRDGLFPRPIHLGGNTSAWVADEIFDWIKARIKERDDPSPQTLAAREAFSARTRAAATTRATNTKRRKPVTKQGATNTSSKVA
jgi:prophage regulatory protein